MTNTFKRLAVPAAISSASATTVYTVPAATSAQLGGVSVVNQSGASGTIKIHHVESGGSADATNCVLDTTTLSDGDNGWLLDGLIMTAAETLQVFADGTNAISISVYGLEQS